MSEGFQKLEPEEDRQTDRHTDAAERITTPHSQDCINLNLNQQASVDV